MKTVTVNFLDADRVDDHQVKDIVQMAIAEYWQRRTPVSEYIATRFDTMPLSWRLAKEASVSNCVFAARHISIDVMGTMAEYNAYQDSIARMHDRYQSEVCALQADLDTANNIIHALEDEMKVLQRTVDAVSYAINNEGA